MKYKYIFLIISDHSLDIYETFRKSWRSYMNLFPEIKCFFIEFKPDLNEDIKESNDYIYVKGSESFHNIIYKTIESMKYINGKYEYDILVRTNLSSVYDFNKLLDKYDSLPKKEFLGGSITFNKFMSGVGIFLSKDVVKYLVDTYEQSKTHDLDDVIIGHILFPKYKKIDLPFLYFIDNDPNTKQFDQVQNHFYFRIKNENNQQRKIDIEIHRKLLKIIYNIDL